MKKNNIIINNTEKSFVEKKVIHMPVTIKTMKQKILTRIAAGLLTVVTAFSAAAFTSAPAAAAESM